MEKWKAFKVTILRFSNELIDIIDHEQSLFVYQQSLFF